MGGERDAEAVPPLSDGVGLDGRHALVTGVSGAIGGAIAAELDAAGATVTGVDLTEPDGEQAWRESGRFAAVDVSDADAVEAGLAAVVDKAGPLDIVVNNAGVNELGAVVDVSIESWDRVLATNLRGTFLVSRFALPSLADTGGSLVNVASTAGLHGAPRYAAYGPSKAAVINLTRQMAHDYAADGVRVNAVAPGVIEAGMALPELADEATAERKRAITLLDRLGVPQDVANAVLYLASDAAGFVTGSTLTVDGGVTA